MSPLYKQHVHRKSWKSWAWVPKSHSLSLHIAIFGSCDLRNIAATMNKPMLRLEVDSAGVAKKRTKTRHLRNWETDRRHVSYTCKAFALQLAKQDIWKWQHGEFPLLRLIEVRLDVFHILGDPIKSFLLDEGCPVFAGQRLTRPTFLWISDWHKHHSDWYSMIG